MRAWRAAHEQQILAELMELVAIPSIAANKIEVGRAADRLTQMFERRGFSVSRIATPGSPVLVARRDAAAAARGTLTFYLHYDGQPTDAKDWTIGQPFEPSAYLNRAKIDLAGVSGPVNPDTRIYGRAAADDKGPIVAFLAAMDGLIDAKATLAVEPACRARWRGRGRLAEFHCGDDG